MNWYGWGNAVANTQYTVSYSDVIPSDKVVGVTEAGQITEADAQCFLVNATTDDYMGADKGNAYTGSSNGRTGGYFYFTTAYPASQFLPDTKYTFHNNMRLTLTEKDPEVTENTNPNVQDVDPQLVTSASVSAQTTWSYTSPKWEDPTGHYMVYKNGNDDHEQKGVAKNNMTHKGGSTGYDLHMWSASRQGWYGLYPSGINDLQDQFEANGNDGGIRLSYTIDSVGYFMPWMFDTSSVNVDGEMAARRAVNYTKPVTLVTTDTGVSIGRYGARLTPGEDYEYVCVEFPETPWVYSGKPQNINPDGSFTNVTAGDGTFRYARDYDKSHWPDIEMQIQRNGEWEHWATVSWKSGSKVKAGRPLR